MNESRAIVERCVAPPPEGLGFAAAGVSDAAPTKHGHALAAWLDAGKHGEMAYLEQHREKLLDPQGLLPGAQSIVCVADRYHDGSPDRIEPGRGRIARYARGADYHRVIKKRLFALADWMKAQWPQAETKVCVDTAPLLEREYAARAGIGAVGKHTLLIGDDGLGSWLLLGAVVTTKQLSPTGNDAAADDPCGSCTRCIDACPTDAITPFSVDATRCISYLTIEHRSVIEESLHPDMGSWVFGCDVCQEVCPHNQPTRRAKRGPVHEAYTPREHTEPGLDLKAMLAWTQEDRREACTTSSMKRAKLPMFKRNAVIALANHADGAVDEQVEALAHDSDTDELVRETVKQIRAQ